MQEVLSSEAGGEVGGVANNRVDLESRKFSQDKARQATGRKLQGSAKYLQADRVKNRAGEDLNRSFGLADRGRPGACQHSPGLSSMWQGADVCNPACA
jgi:hypothetical protein